MAGMRIAYFRRTGDPVYLGEVIRRRIEETWSLARTADDTGVTFRHSSAQRRRPTDPDQWGK
jgi:hypothetical protein